MLGSKHRDARVPMMGDPIRLIDSATTSALAHTILCAWDSERPTASAAARTLASLIGLR